MFAGRVRNGTSHDGKQTKEGWMFTGIIEELGTVEEIEPRGDASRMRIRCRTVREDSVEGSSIAVNGVCLTATDLRTDSFAADLAPETLRRSNLGDLRAGSRVNLERPLSPAGRLSGHIVQGHVDGTGELLSLDRVSEDHWWLRVRVPPGLESYLVYKGSISIDGISLTVAELEGSIVSVTIIPHTYRNTTLNGYRTGARVNIECDIIAKHVARLFGNLQLPSRITPESLREHGY
jgi:riboflavin synthase